MDKEYHRDWYRKNKQSRDLSLATYADSLAGALTNCIRNMRSKVARSGREVAIDRTHLMDLWEQQNGLCALSGLPMDIKRASLKRVSLDRIDSAKGYSHDNIQLVCQFANLAKGNNTSQELKAILKEISDG